MVGYTFYSSDPRVRRHVSNLAGDGYEIDVITLREAGKTETGLEGRVSHYHAGFRDYAKQGKLDYAAGYLAFTAACSRILMRNNLAGGRYSLVHVNNMPNFLLVSALPLKALGVPVLLDVHDTMPEIFQEKFGVGPSHRFIRLLLAEERVCMRLADFVITTEHTKRDRLAENGLSTEKSDVVLNLPDPAIFPCPDIEKLTPKSRSETFRLVYHGTLARRLGVDVAIRAVGILKDRIPEIRFDVIGDGEQRPELVRLVRELGLEGRVRLSDGFVPVERLPSLLEGADLAVIPSRQSIATKLMLPTKLLEYARLGIPCAAVPTPTIRRYFSEGMARFFNPDDPAALASTIFDLHGNPADLAAIARKAREFYSIYSFEAERDRYLAIVRRLIL